MSFSESAGFFVSFFQNFTWVGIGLAALFGIIWLAGFWPPFYKAHWLFGALSGMVMIAFTVWIVSLSPSVPWYVTLPVLVIVDVMFIARYFLPFIKKKPGLHLYSGFGAVFLVSAILTLAAIAFVQVPLQFAFGNLLSRFISRETTIDWLLLLTIPGVLLSGFVQEGAKAFPILYFWQSQGNKLSPRLGICLGAVAGAGYAVFESNWIHGLVFASGWSWEVVGNIGFNGITPFWERFFVTAFHIGASALVGYGLARGRGWRFYLIASLLHGGLNYIAVMAQASVIKGMLVEYAIAVWALGVVGFALWLRWKKEPPEALPIAVMPTSPPPAEPVGAGASSPGPSAP